jgi:hypothetical protein
LKGGEMMQLSEEVLSLCPFERFKIYLLLQGIGFGVPVQLLPSNQLDMVQVITKTLRENSLLRTFGNHTNTFYLLSDYFRIECVDETGICFSKSYSESIISPEKIARFCLDHKVTFFAVVPISSTINRAGVDETKSLTPTFFEVCYE